MAPASGSPAPAIVRSCPPPQPVIVVTESDAGKTFTVRPGTRILVRLSGGGMWSEPMTSDGSVVTRVSASRDAQGDASGDFRAVSAGHADLSATAAPTCWPRCMAMVRAWVVHIVVVA